MLIGGLQKFTLIDYPEKVAAVVFTVGCNFRCGFCHNPELIHSKMSSVPSVKSRGIIPDQEVLTFLKTRIGDLDGVCITGGEPTLQPDLVEFIRKIKNLHLDIGCPSGAFAVKLDSNGTNPEVLRKLIKDKLIDYIAMDIKAPVGAMTKSELLISNKNLNDKISKTKYHEITGMQASDEKVRESVEIIRSSGLDYEFRTTILPKFHTKEDLLAIGEWLKGSKKYFIQQFRAHEGKLLDESFINEKSFSSQELAEFCELLKPYFGYCGVRE